MKSGDGGQCSPSQQRVRKQTRLKLSVAPLTETVGLLNRASNTCAQHPGQCLGGGHPWASETFTASLATAIWPLDYQASMFTHAQNTPEATHASDEVQEVWANVWEAYTCPWKF